MRWLAYIAWAAVLALPLLVAEAQDIAAWRLTQDAVQAAQVPAWTGALSTVGLLGWAFAGGACLIAGLVLRSVEPGSERVRFLLATTVFLLYLGLDDALLIHDDVFPNRFNVPQPVVLAVLGAVAIGFAWRFRDQLRQGDTPTLALAVLGLGASATADLLDVLSLALEDSFKAFGIGLLAYWCFDWARRALAEALQEPGEPGASPDSRTAPRGWRRSPSVPRRRSLES